MTRRLTAVVSLALLGVVTAARADVKLPAIFGDHMVLQQDAALPVWGTAAPGEAVTVTLGRATAGARADAQGRWRVTLPAVPAGSAPGTLTVKAANTLQFQDVLVGDVWLASGQSNMQFGLGQSNTARDDLPKANQPQIRYFIVPRAAALQPLDDVGPAPAPNEQLGRWQVCTPETLARDGFSAAGYYFARDIHEATRHPVGVIGSYWGGTPAQSWTSLAGLQKEPLLAEYAANAQREAANPNTVFPFRWAEYDAAKRQWDAEFGKEFSETLKAWQEAAKNAKAAGQPEPPRPQPVKPPPRDLGVPNAPTVLFNGMIAPLMPYAIKGVIWYQGESNAPRASEYATLFPRMIQDWREKWGAGDFPFLFVQLANFNGNPTESWATLRESQSHALALPKTGMAVTIDIGNPTDIHPRDKLDVGKRLALAARRVAYGENVVDSGPVYRSAAVENGRVRLAFGPVGGGLVVGSPPAGFNPGQPPAPPAAELRGFAVAGADRRWVEAKATIEGGNSVVVTSDAVKVPAAVRYDWANSPTGNLYNKEGLPAVPFRTDRWPFNAEPDGSHAKQFADWYQQCADRVAAIQGKPCDLIFIGDSITQNFIEEPKNGWNLVGRAVWDKHFANRHALDFGVGADGTQHALWRLENMNVQGLRPKVAVVLLGINNAGDTAEDIAGGVKAVIEKAQGTFPGVKVIAVSILANGRAPGKMTAANAIIRTFADNRSVFYLDVAAKMPPVGNGWKGVGGDKVHLTPEGYEIWATELDPMLRQLLGP